MTSHVCPPPTQSPRIDVCVGFIGWGEIKSSLMRGEGVQLPLHNAIWRQSWARSKSGLAFLLTFLNIKLLKTTHIIALKKNMEDSEDPSAKIGIFLIKIIMTFWSNRASKQTRPFFVHGQAK